MPENTSPSTSPAPTVQMRQLTLSCPPEQAGFLEAFLWTVEGVVSVTEEYRPDADSDQTRLEHLSAILVLLQQPEAEQTIQGLLESQPELEHCHVTEAKWIAEADWAESWKQYWHPVQITDRLVICPTWDKDAYQPTPGIERVIYLDPGRAFGTGTHETTRLMLMEMETLAQDQDFSQISILDVGTGSGILAIDAAKLGCQSVMAIDNDPLSVTATEANAMLNGVAHQLTVSGAPLDELCRTPYDIVLANIIAPVILELMDDMLIRLKPGGYLLMSGLIEKSVPSILNRLQGEGLTVIRQRQMGDWFAVLGQK